MWVCISGGWVWCIGRHLAHSLHTPTWHDSCANAHTCILLCTVPPCKYYANSQVVHFLHYYVYKHNYTGLNATYKYNAIRRSIGLIADT